jgi:predicted RNase H-like nuclease (RuvC/YqgF family)
MDNKSKNNNKINELVSSLKDVNFTGKSSEQIIEKYEMVLASREKQITDLSIEIGNLNERISELSEKLKNYEKENVQLKSRLEKRVNIYYNIYYYINRIIY